MRWNMPIRRNRDRHQDKRKFPRSPGGTLVAHYWTGGAPTPHKVCNVSVAGAFIESSDEWPPGTVIRLILQPRPAQPPGSAETSLPPGPLPFEVHASVVRLAPDGFGLRFLFRNANERSAFERFLHESLAVAAPDISAHG